MEWAALEPREAAELMSGYGRRWWIAGGWAIDLFLGRKTRAHADVDLAVLRADQSRVREHFREWDVAVAHDGVLRAWRGEPLELPLHTLWARRSARGPWELELLLMESRGERWLFRRDPRITLELERIGLERDGIPFLTPEIPLLYKAKEPREHDEADFAAVAPGLAAERRAWLAAGIRSQDARHPWLAQLRAAAVTASRSRP